MLLLPIFLPMSQPYYGPVEDKDTIDIERFFLAGDFVAGTGYGTLLLRTFLALRCTHQLILQVFSLSYGPPVRGTYGSNTGRESGPASCWDT